MKILPLKPESCKNTANEIEEKLIKINKNLLLYPEISEETIETQIEEEKQFKIKNEKEKERIHFLYWRIFQFKKRIYLI